LKTNPTPSLLAVLLLSALSVAAAIPSAIKDKLPKSGGEPAVGTQPARGLFAPAPAWLYATATPVQAARPERNSCTADASPRGTRRLNVNKIDLPLNGAAPSIVAGGVGGPNQTPAYKYNARSGSYEPAAGGVKAREPNKFNRSGGDGVIVRDIYDVQVSSVSPDQIVELSKHPEMAEPYVPHAEVGEDAVNRRLKNARPGKNNIQDAADLKTPANSLVSPDSSNFVTQPDAPPGPATVSVSQNDPTAFGKTPPDVDMAAGPNHIITDYNLVYSIFPKTGGVATVSGATFRSLFTGLTNCGTASGGGGTNLSDPQVSYDDEKDRFVFAMLGYHTGVGGAVTASWLCLAATKTGDPVAGGFWNAQVAITPLPQLADYPHIGIGEDAIFIGTNNFDANGFVAPMITAVNKANLYAGVVPATRATVMGDNFRPQPAERRGYKQGGYPPPGTPHFFVVENGTTGLGEIWRWPQPTFTSNAAFWGNFNTFSGSPEDPNNAAYSSWFIDSLNTGYMDAELRWPKLWTARTGVVNKVTSVDDAVQWAEVDVSGTTPVLGNSGLYTVSGNQLWLPDVTVDRLNNFAVGMSRASATGPVLVGPYITGREAGGAAPTPANTLEALTVSKVGDKIFTGALSTSQDSYRWGDYQGVAIDPDGCTIWFNGPYSANVTGNTTASWIHNFKYASCNVNDGLTFNKSTLTCTDALTVTLQDVTAFTAAYASAQVTITTGTDTENIPAASWVCDFITGAAGAPNTACAGGLGNRWHVTIPVSGAAGANQNGTINFTAPATITALYTDTHGGTHANQTRVASGTCTPTITDAGFSVAGGCDNGISTGAFPNYSGESHNNYMDNGEINAYTFKFVNNSDRDLSNAVATLSSSTPGTVTIYNPSVTLGRVPRLGQTGGVFSIGVNGAAGLATTNLTLSVTSPTDGFTTPATLVQTQYLQTNDTIERHNKCFLHNSMDMTDSKATYNLFNGPGWTQKGTATPSNPWAFFNGTQGSETMSKTGFYGTPACGSAALGSVMVGNPAVATNFGANADSVLLANFQPTNFAGAAPNGQPWNYVWLAHSFYYATELIQNRSGVWGALYDPTWNSAVAPVADSVERFPLSFAYYYDALFDPDASIAQTVWNWDAADTGTPEDPVTPPKNQFVNLFDQTTVRGTITPTSYFSFGHEHLDADTTAGANADIAIDNDQLIWDEYYRTSQGAVASCPSGQVGQVAFGASNYTTCPATSILVSVTDPNRVAPFNATVTSASGDSETVAMTGAGPYFTGTLNISTLTGGGSNNGTLFVLPTDTLTASYTDTSPAGTTTATATVGCTGGDVIVSGSKISTNVLYSNGDLDVFADTNESISYQVSITNNMAVDLQNASVKISTNSPAIDCILTDTVNYGTIAAGTTVTNPVTSQFKFHVSNSFNCSAPSPLPKATFTVYISGTNFDGSQSVQTFDVVLDLNGVGAPTTFTEPFTTDPGWVTNVGPGDEDKVARCASNLYVNDWKYTAANGRVGGGYTAWTGDTAFGVGQYRVNTDSMLYTPVFYMGTGASTVLTFDREYQTETGWDGAAVQYNKNGTGWNYITMPGMSLHNLASAATACMAFDWGVAQMWTNQTAQAWTAAVASPAIPTTQFDTIQFRFRLGSDSSLNFAGFGIDNVNITNIQPLVCDATNNSALPGCPSSGPKPVSDGATRPGTATLAVKAGANTTVTWNTASCGSSNYNIYWGSIAGGYTALTGGSCAIGTTGSWTGAIPDGSWYVIVGTGGGQYGSFGLTSSSAEEAFTGASTACAAYPTQNLGGTCP
jgi:hypothetical protein